MSSYKIDSVSNISHTKSIQNRTDDPSTQKTPNKSHSHFSNNGELSKLLNIVKAHSEAPVSSQKIEELREQLSHNLYKPDIEQLIQQITTSLISKGLI